jgi:hypothetical protein
MGEETNGYLIARVQANQEAAGAYYQIETNTINGVKFEGSGIVTAGNQMVTLFATGTPSSHGIFSYNITSNSTDPAAGNLKVDLIVTARIIKTLVLCESGSSWDLWGNTRGVQLMLQNTTLFGPTSVYCPVNEMRASRSNSGTITQASLDTLDIVILAYNVVPDGASTTRLVNWVKDGGVLIHCQELGGNQDSIMTKLVGLTSSNRISFSGSGQTVKLTGVPGDSIIYNTGYMDLPGKSFGFDGGGNSYYTIPAGLQSSIDVLATSTSGAAAILKSKKYGYILIGDGGPFSGGTSSGPIYNTNHPTRVTNSAPYMPIVFSGSGFTNVHNAHFFVNTMIWAIQRRLAIAP